MRGRCSVHRPPEGEVRRILTLFGQVLLQVFLVPVVRDCLELHQLFTGLGRNLWVVTSHDPRNAGSGQCILCGIVPVHVAERDEFTGAAIGSSPREVAEQAARLWEELGFSHQDRASKLSIAPVSGFAHSDVDETIAQLRAGREAAELMRRAAGDL